MKIFSFFILTFLLSLIITGLIIKKLSKEFNFLDSLIASILISLLFSITAYNFISNELLSLPNNLYTNIIEYTNSVDKSDINKEDLNSICRNSGNIQVSSINIFDIPNTESYEVQLSLNVGTVIKTDKNLNILVTNNENNKTSRISN